MAVLRRRQHHVPTCCTSSTLKQQGRLHANHCRRQAADVLCVEPAHPSGTFAWNQLTQVEAQCILARERVLVPAVYGSGGSSNSSIAECTSKHGQVARPQRTRASHASSGNIQAVERGAQQGSPRVETPVLGPTNSQQRLGVPAAGEQGSNRLQQAMQCRCGRDTAACATFPAAQKPQPTGHILRPTWLAGR